MAQARAQRYLSTLVVAALLLCSCAHYTTEQRWAAGTAAACIVADTATTMYGREARGLREVNPLADSYLVWTAVQLAVYGAVYWYGERNPNARVAGWLASGLPRCGVAAWNATQLR